MKNINELKGSKPNIIFIISDDHGYGDLSFKNILGDVNTPNLDRLRASGMLLEQGYVSAPVCSPSRAGLIVGSYQQRWGAKYFGSARFAPESVKTIPEILKTVEYRTGYFGKVHYGSDKPGGRECPENHGFDESFYGLAAMGMGRLHYLIHEIDAKEKFGKKTDIHNMYPMFENGKPVDCHNFLTYEFADRAMKFMDESGGTRVPFIFSWNGVIPKNQSSRNLSSTLDLLSTFAYLAGADIPESNHNDGLSLMPTLLGENGGHDKLFFDTGFQYSVRDKEWKLLGKGEDFEDARKALLKVEHADLGEGDRLFNISENIDESEQSNFIQENPEITERLRNAFEEWKEDIESTKF